MFTNGCALVARSAAARERVIEEGIHNEAADEERDRLFEEAVARDGVPESGRGNRVGYFRHDTGAFGKSARRQKDR